jgi:hypothetical protein
MLCRDNWIDLTWDGASSRTGKENIQVKFRRQAKTLINFDLACNMAAQEIFDTHKDLYLGLSGGADSEYVATCFHRNGIPFTPIILQYNLATSNDQAYESWYAKQWCRQHNVEPLIVNIDNYVTSDHEKSVYHTLKPRLLGGAVTAGFLKKFVDSREGKLISGFQIEYYPDHEQMNYLEPQLASYNGFVLEESDLYIETLGKNQHPWAFFYWSPEIVAGFVHGWNVNKTMTENKSLIYKTSHRPKFSYPRNLFPGDQGAIRQAIADSKWGTIDCALLGTREQLLSQLLE